MRIGGCIKQVSVSQDIKRPVVLPGQGHISNILARHYHEKALHQGKGITLNVSLVIVAKMLSIKVTKFVHIKKIL